MGAYGLDLPAAEGQREREVRLGPTRMRVLSRSSSLDWIGLLAWVGGRHGWKYRVLLEIRWQLYR